MNKFNVLLNIKLIILLLITIPFLFLNKPVRAEKSVEKSTSINNQIEAKKLDDRAVVLSQYLAKFDSPLQYHAQDFINASDAYGLDWKMLPAIAGVESTFGKHIPGGYNAWGWGVYGTQAIYFSSWKAGMFTIAKGLRENYLDKGLTDPYLINPVYASSTSWGWKVDYFMKEIESFAKQFEDYKQETASIGTDPQTAAISGRPRLEPDKLVMR